MTGPNFINLNYELIKNTQQLVVGSNALRARMRELTLDTLDTVKQTENAVQLADKLLDHVNDVWVGHIKLRADRRKAIAINDGANGDQPSSVKSPYHRQYGSLPSCAQQHSEP